MKKSWSTARVNSVHKSRRRALGSVVFLFTCAVLLLWFFPRISTSMLTVFWYPAEQFRVWLAESDSSMSVLLRERQELTEQIRTLETHIATEQGTEGTIRRLQVENEQLRSLVGALPAERILARVVSRPPQLPYDLIMFDRGTRDGVVEGAPVFAGKDTVIGVVALVSERTSYAKLISDPQMVVTVFIVGPNIFTIAEGLGNGIVRVRVPQGVPINETDLVLLPAIDAGVIGSIEEVVTSPTDPERHGYISFPTNIQSLQYVSIGAEKISTPDFSDVVVSVNNQVSELLSVSVPPEILVQTDVIDISQIATSSTSTSTGIGTSTVESIEE